MKQEESDVEKVKQLKEYFTNRDDVVMAFLFGSRSSGQIRKSSDWNIGAYLAKKTVKKKEKFGWKRKEY